MPDWGVREWTCWRLCNEVLRRLYQRTENGEIGPVDTADLERELHIRHGGLTKLYHWRGYGLLRVLALLEERHGKWTMRIKDEKRSIAAIAFGEKLPTEPVQSEEADATFQLLTHEQWNSVAHAGRRVVTEKGEEWEAFYGTWTCNGRSIGVAELLNTRVRIPTYGEP